MAHRPFEDMMIDFATLQAEAKENYQRTVEQKRPRVIVGMGTCEIDAGARRVYRRLEELIASQTLDVSL